MNVERTYLTANDLLASQHGMYGDAVKRNRRSVDSGGHQLYGQQREQATTPDKSGDQREPEYRALRYLAATGLASYGGAVLYIMLRDQNRHKVVLNV